jgi:hypothetical protein
MSSTPPLKLPSQNPDELVRWVTTAPNRPVQIERLTALSRVYHSARDSIGLFNRLAISPVGPRLALEFVGRMPTPVSPGLVLLSAPLLQSKKVSPQLRVIVAAKLVASLPDNPESVGPVVRSLTAGLGKLKTLERLSQLDARLKSSNVISSLLAKAERETKLKCPKCPVTFTRPELIKHLWTKHGKRYGPKGVQAATSIIEEAVVAVTPETDGEAIDRVYSATTLLFPKAEPRQVHQAILSRSRPQAEEVEPLCRAAREKHCGLCPACFTELRPVILPLPDPLVVDRDRVLGEGYSVDVSPRRVTVRYPNGDLEELADAPRPVDSRRQAVTWGTALTAVGAGLAGVLPLSGARPFGIAFLGCLAGLGTYAWLRFGRSRRSGQVQAVDVAWTELSPRIGRSPVAVRFLTRLCRGSLGIGDVGERSRVLMDLVKQSSVLAEKNSANAQLYAVASVLQSNDYARIGKQWTTNLLDLFRPVFRGESTVLFAEAVAECLTATDELTDKEAIALRFLLPAAAFDAGHNPPGLAALAEQLPNFGRLVGGTLNWFELLHEVWKGRTTQPWASAVGPAQAVFEYIRLKPNSMVRTLSEFPDTLLVATLDPEFDAVFGEILIGRRGVTVGDVTLADPTADIRGDVVKGTTPVLVFGPHRLQMPKKVSDRVLRVLKGWVRYYAERLLPAAGSSANVPPSRISERLLSGTDQTCSHCGIVCRVRTGEVGVRVG